MVAPAVEAWTLPAGHAEIDDLLGASTALASETQLLDAVRSVEALRCRLAALDAAVLAEVERRGIAGKRSQQSTKALLHAMLRIDPADAAARVRAAGSVGPRQALTTGEPLAARFPQVAAALADGRINPDHARVIARCIDTLPADVREQAHDHVETLLVEAAVQSDPVVVRNLGHDVHAWLNPDGTLPNDRLAQHDRALDLRVRADGSSSLRGELTPEATERLRTLLDAITHPRNLAPDQTDADPAGDPNEGIADDTDREMDGITPPPVPGPIKDPRSATQRRHDGFLQLLRLLQANGSTPTAGGVHTTVLLTLRAEDWLDGTGVAHTGHGTLINAADAIQWAGGNPQVLTVALDKLGKVTAYSTLARLFNEPQRLVMVARDGCCSFPDCDAPIWYCEADHITAWGDHGPTSVDNGHLPCVYHHRVARAQGWTPVMIDGRPGWIPPPWIDPDQQPRFNHRNRWFDPFTDLRTDGGTDPSPD